ncbi:MAG: DNA mismatch repair protein MutS [Candidatus Avilachnospira sp.]|jgi:DNA mismatch repair protein MutS
MAEQKMSPMMEHYMETKKQYPDCILFYRLGDFYEMFFEDAETAARELELVLTGKDCGLAERAPMCGVPFHAADSYITRLVKKGYKVAVAEQMEDPKLAKGLVKREVIRVVTPGTITATDALDEAKNNYLMSLAYICGEFGISVLDISTGDFLVTQTSDMKTVTDEINRFQPSEIICNDELMMSGIDTEALKNTYHIMLTPLERRYYDEENDKRILKEHFHCEISGLGLSDFFAGTAAAGAALQYAYDTQFNTVSNITALKTYATGQYMIIDSAANRNLELLETLREKQKRGTLLWVLDKTRTAMGARLLRSMIEQPLLSKEAIENRLDAIEELNQRFIDREEIIEYLRPIYDLERLLSRITSQGANPRDLLAFKSSLGMVPHIKNVLKSFKSDELSGICDDLCELPEIYDLIDRAINEDPPVSVRDGGIIKEGYDQDADNYRKAKTDGKKWLYELEASEREKTGIRTLKIKFNKVFGYCIEVSNSFKNDVPDYFVRKQTLTSGERYTTERLDELADIILGAEDKLNALEYELFCQVRDRIAAEVKSIHRLSKALALLDVYCSLSVVSMRNNYVRPVINTEGIIDIKNGRHPVVELMLGDGQFVSNDTYLNKDEDRISIITGPNMAGKSTYMRQVALTVIMAQIGSFVPATKANICICDRIFTRVGASDDLASGQSTFMVEMTEVANILRNAGPDSLLILDEIGRGTSTFDGLSIAWAVVEYISQKLGAKTLFATHYHELTELEGKLSGIQNFCIAVKENGEDIIFLRKIVPGGADKSYGIQVARLAGIPENVTSRATEIAELLGEADINKATAKLANKLTAKKSRDDNSEKKKEQKKYEEVAREIKKLDVTKLTPIEAINILYNLKEGLND